MPWRADSPRIGPLGIVALAVPLTCLLVARLAFGFDGLSGQDGHEYARYATAIQHWLAGGPHPGWHYWPVGYALIGALLGSAIGDPVLALQIVSALALGATALAVTGIIHCIGFAEDEPQARSIFAGAVLFVPSLLLAGVLVMSDMLATALACGAIWAWLAMRQSPAALTLVLFAVLTTAAVWTRYGVFALLFLPGCDVLRIALARVPKRAIAFAILATVPFFATHFVLKQMDSSDLFSQYALQSWSPANWFARQFSTADGTSTFPLPNLAYVLSFIARPSWFPMPLLLLFSRPRDFGSAGVRLLLLSTALYLLFIAGIPFQNHRFQLPVAPLVAVLLFPAALRLAGLVRSQPLRLAMLLGAGAMALLLHARQLGPYIERNRLERQIAAKLETYPAAVPLYLFAFEPALINREVRQPMRNLWKARYREFPDGALVLFAPETLAKQWRGRNPMLNWEQLAREKRLSVQAEFGGGWRLYRIEGAR